MKTDTLIVEFDRALRTLLAPASTVRPVPGNDLPEAELSEAERTHVAALMRINHCGEICAQALYQGQALTSRSDVARQSLEKAGREETEHLAWTARRIEEMGGRKSLLNPFWYAGSLAMGIVAGQCGDRWNLGFLAETERQVEAHLEGHKTRLPEQDQRSRAILEQMRVDEARHAEMALQLGAKSLPDPIKTAMRLSAKVMTSVAYYV